MIKLTPRQLQVVRAVEALSLKGGIAPSYRELSKDVGCSSPTVFELVTRCVTKGALKKCPKARSIELTVAMKLQLRADPLEELRIAWEACDEEQRTAFLDEIDF